MNPVTDSFPYDAVFRIIESTIGMAVHEGNRDILCLRIDRMIQELELDRNMFFTTLSTRPDLQEALFDRITTHETAFCREQRAIEFAARTLDGMKHDDSGHTLRVLSAGCAGGEELYSLRMEILSHFPAISDTVQMTGIDLSGSCIDQAREGSYSAHAIRNVPIPDLERYFNQATAGRFSVSPELKKGIRFVKANLFTHETGGEMYDMILCRNLLMYLSEPKRNGLLHRMKSWLRPSGILLLAAAETLRDIPSDLISQRTDTLFYYRRQTGGRNDQSPAG